MYCPLNVAASIQLKKTSLSQVEYLIPARKPFLSVLILYTKGLQWQ
jgi:hypothetical protein